MTQLIDRTGLRFGRLVVERRDPDPPDKPGKHVWWICRCDCGAAVTVRGLHLARGTTQSCGCLHREISSERHSTHRMTGTPTWRSWKSARRAAVPMCEAWRESFEAFLADMGERPPGTKLGRRDLSSGYQPDNCAWMAERALKAARPSTPLFAWRGADRSLPEIADLEGISLASLKRRLSEGLPVERAIEVVRARSRPRRTKI